MKFLRRSAGRTVGEERVELGTDDGAPVGRGLWFWGRPASGLRAWADLVVEDVSILPEVAGALGPGSSLMIAYASDDTERALRRRVPPAATPLGLALLGAGCRWFKDWYYPEGGREGGTKLQATLPLDEERRIAAEQQLVRDLSDFLARRHVRDEDRERVLHALEILGVDTSELASRFA
jgi:hypothetical protein